MMRRVLMWFAGLIVSGSLACSPFAQRADVVAPLNAPAHRVAVFIAEYDEDALTIDPKYLSVVHEAIQASFAPLGATEVKVVNYSQTPAAFKESMKIGLILPNAGLRYPPPDPAVTVQICSDGRYDYVILLKLSFTPEKPHYPKYYHESWAFANLLRADGQLAAFSFFDTEAGKLYWKEPTLEISTRDAINRTLEPLVQGLSKASGNQPITTK